MDIGISEAVDLARRWQRKETKIKGTVFTNSQELQIKFTDGRMIVFNDEIILKSDGGFELVITLLPEMMIKYGESVLEIRHSGFRCVLYEPRD